MIDALVRGLQDLPGREGPREAVIVLLTAMGIVIGIAILLVIVIRRFNRPL